MFSTPKPPELKPVLSMDIKPDMPAAPPARPSATLIAKGVKVEGDFNSDGDVQIEGEVKGSLSTKGRLTVGNDASIHAEVKAGDAVISGAIEGNVIIERRAELKSTAKITGDITAEALIVEAGASINGKVSVGSSKKAA